MTDWAVWPIFLIQAFALLFMLLPKKMRFFGLSTHFIVICLLIVVGIAMLASLYHDSTTALHLNF